MTSKKAKDITEEIYQAYGTDSGYLFGIDPHDRAAVEAIVQVTIDMYKDKVGVEIDNNADMED
jgi:hypothetical protein